MKSVNRDNMKKMIEKADLPLDLSHQESASLGCDPEGNSGGAAVRMYRETLKSDPNDVAAMSNLAWILSTSAEPKLRSGREALKLAQQAHTLAGGNDLVILSVLAAAHAEARSFDKAIAAANQALELAELSGHEEFIAALRNQIRNYEGKQPWREELAQAG